MPRRFHFADLLVAGGAMALTTVAVLAWATRVDVQTTREAVLLAELEGRRVTAAATLAELERRAGEDAAMRQTVSRRLEDLQARYPARFSAALGEASRVRPKGVWLTRFYWTGAEVKAEGCAWGTAPAAEFVGRLAQSPHFAQVFTAPLPAGGPSETPGPDRFLLFAHAVAK
jgi:Tfp pilus assembly protein PilN